MERINQCRGREQQQYTEQLSARPTHVSHHVRSISMLLSLRTWEAEALRREPPGPGVASSPSLPASAATAAWRRHRRRNRDSTSGTACRTACEPPQLRPLPGRSVAPSAMATSRTLTSRHAPGCHATARGSYSPKSRRLCGVA
eukprot:6273536-Prymnesium_polylepis.1